MLKTITAELCETITAELLMYAAWTLSRCIHSLQPRLKLGLALVCRNNHKVGWGRHETKSTRNNSCSRWCKIMCARHHQAVKKRDLHVEVYASTVAHCTIWLMCASWVFILSWLNALWTRRNSTRNQLLGPVWSLGLKREGCTNAKSQGVPCSTRIAIMTTPPKFLFKSFFGGREFENPNEKGENP